MTKRDFVEMSSEILAGEDIKNGLQPVSCQVSILYVVCQKANNNILIIIMIILWIQQLKLLAYIYAYTNTNIIDLFLYLYIFVLFEMLPLSVCM